MSILEGQIPFFERKPTLTKVVLPSVVSIPN